MFNIFEILPRIKSIYSALKECTSKIQQSAKFIDFFAHDVLDFSILHKDGQKFKKQKQVFDIREAVGEIIELQKDKTNLKGLRITTRYEGFQN